MMITNSNSTTSTASMPDAQPLTKLRAPTAKPFKTMPGPKGHWLLGSVPTLRRGMLEFLESMHQNHGDVLKTRLLHRDVMLLSHPDLVSELLLGKASELRKNRDVGGIRVLIGKGLLSNHGEDHARQRRLIEPAFRHDSMARYAKIIVERTEAHAKRLAGTKVKLHDELSRLTLEIVCEALFGVDVDEAADTIGHALELWITRAIEQWTFPVPLKIPTPRNRAALRGLDEVNKLLFGLIEQRRAELAEADAGDETDPGKRRDLLSTLVRASDAEGGMSNEQLRDEVVTLMLAGHETTAIALTFALMLLSDHGDAAAKLDAELEEVLGGRSPEFSDIKQLKFTKMVVEEAMRLYPPAWIIGREVTTETFEIGGYHVPKGTQIFASPWLLHRDERFFDDATTFKPERFENRDWPRGAYMPFGMGGRSCVGMHFAMTEAILVLATFWQRCGLQRQAGEVELQPSITLRPKCGLPTQVVGR